MEVITRRDTERVTYQPALDGLRAVAAIAVLLYHHHRGPGFGRVGRGGFLGVDVFFVLSGYLITSLLLKEHASSGSVAFGRFWGRRARRLIPALLVMLVLVVVLSRFVYSAGEQHKVHDELLYTLFYVENWHIAIWHGSLSSAIGHTWSLSVEEQFYLVWPVVLVGLLAVTRRWPRRLTLVLAGLAVASAVWTALWLSPLRAFFGTDARAQELLVGATLAAVATRFGGLAVPERFRRMLNGAGVVLLVWLVAMLLGAPGSAAIWQRGGTLAFAIGTAMLIAIAVQALGPARVILTAPVLVAIGQISYGVYLFHFPVFVWTGAWTGVNRVMLLVIRVSITFAIAIASYRLVEQPIRKGRYSPRVLIPVGVFVAAGILVLAPVGTASPASQSKVLSVLLARAADGAPPSATRVLVVGGNRAFLLNFVSKGAVGTGSMWGLALGTSGCGLTSLSPRCRAIPEDLRALAGAFRANAVVFMPDEHDLAEHDRRAVTARLEAMRHAIGRRPVGILTVPCVQGIAEARHAFNATLTTWARRHRVAIDGAVPCGAGKLPDASATVVWQSIAKLITATHPTA